MKPLWTDFQECFEYFQNFFSVLLQFFSEIIWNFRAIFRKFFQKFPWKFHKISIKMFFSKVCANGFLYFFQVFKIFFRNFSLISLKLFQKNFKFFNNININYELLQFFPIMFSQISWNHLKFSSQFLENFFKIFWKFSKNFIKIPQELWANPKILNLFFKTSYSEMYRKIPKIIMCFNSLIFFKIFQQFFRGFLKISPKIFKNYSANSPKSL